MASPIDVLKSKVGILADPIAEYVAAILADYSGIVIPPDASGNPPVDGSGTPELPPVITPPAETAPTLPTIADTDTVYQIVDYSGGNFVKGISVKDNAVLLRPAQAVKAGLKLRFKNGQGSIIVSNEPIVIAGVTLAKVVVGAINLTEALGAPGSVTLYGMATVPTPTPEPTPDPTPTPNPQPSAEYKNIPLGVNGHEGREISYPKAEMEARIKLLADNNLKSYRTDVGTGYLDNTTEMNRLIGLCQKYGVTLRPMIYPTTEANAYKYAKAYGDRVKVWEIGNEVNLKGKAAAAGLIAEMVATYKGMKRASDELGLNLKFTINVTACNSNYSGATCYGDKRGDIWFLEQAKAAGFNFDYVSFHYYAYIGELGSWYDLYFGQIVAISKMYGAKVFFNEMNAGEIYKAGTTGNEASTANSLRQFLNEAQKYKDYIQEINVYEFLDEPNMEGQEAHFGIRTNLATKKPLWDVVTEFALAKVDVPQGFVRRKKGKVAVNGAVGAGADHVIPGIESTNYTMLKTSEMDRIKSYGITDIRLGFLEGRIFPEAANPLKYWQGNDVTQPSWGRTMTLDHLIRIGEQAADRGMTIMLDNHSYGYFPSNGAPNKALLGSTGNTVDMWVERQYQLLKLLKGNTKAWSAIKRYDVINEPYMAEHDAKFLAAAYQKLLDRCGPLTGTDLIYVFEGPAYSSMSRWAELVGDSFDNLSHPNGRAYIEFSAHGYLDRGKDGYFDENKDGVINEADQLLASGETWETLVASRAKGFVEWSIKKNFNVSVGETVVPGNLPLFLKAFDELLTYLLDNGVTVYVFAVGDSIDKASEHNLETTNALSGGKLDNTNTLNVVKAKAKIYNV